MKLRLLVVLAALSSWFGCQCGPEETNPCTGVRCSTGLVCNPELGRCVLAGDGGAGPGPGTDGGTGGGGGGGCAQTCSGATPVCDSATGTCKTCTETTGCTGLTPVCQPIANGGLGKCVVCTVNAGCGGATPVCDPTAFPDGACYQCVTALDCPVPGSACDEATHTCVAGTGGGAGGGTGGGTGGGSGGAVEFDDAGMTARCLPFDAGVKSCTTECPTGYECLSGICELRGSKGPVQVTLRWNQKEDLDLYVVEPLPNGGTCEIFYQQPGVNPNPPPIPLPFPLPNLSCGAKGWLDLDANAACGSGTSSTSLTDKAVENIIYSPGVVPTPGLYTVRVNYWEDCFASGPVPFEVEVRAMGATRWYCGQFQPSDANGGGKGAGRVITQFRVP